MIVKAQDERTLADEVGEFYADLGGYIMWAYPWGEPDGPLEHFEGPETWVMDLADEISEAVKERAFNGHDPVDPVYIAVASGNGAAKSAFAGMFNSWIMSTRPESRVTVSANTGSQLRTKTWPEIDKWTQLALTSDWFERQTERIYHVDNKLKWFTTAHTWNMANTQASAGQHSRVGSSVFIIDESSHVPEPILLQMDGGMTDGEPFFLLLGNCTNRASRLFRAVFGNLKGKYIHRSIDTRKCRYTNKKQIAAWIEERGEDSDWVKAHIKGEAPNADDLQFIDNLRVQIARRRYIADPTAPLILGLDFARGGKASNRLAWRQGRNGKPYPSRRIPGDKTRDTTLMVTLISNEIDEKKPDAVCGDAGNMGGPIMDQLRKLHRRIPIIDVMFGGGAPDDRHGNMRSYIWDECRLWLPGGCIEDDEQLEIDLTGPHSYENVAGRLFLESKEDMEDRGLDSPDWGDAFCTTFAIKTDPRKPIALKKKPVIPPHNRPKVERGWMRR